MKGLKVYKMPKAAKMPKAPKMPKSPSLPDVNKALRAPAHLSGGKAMAAPKLGGKMPTLKDMKVPTGGLMNKGLRQGFGKVPGLNT